MGTLTADGSEEEVKLIVDINGERIIVIKVSIQFSF
jgi:hypothetical protein